MHCSASPVRVPDAGVYTVGLAVFPSHNPLHRASSALPTAPQPPAGVIEVKSKSKPHLLTHHTPLNLVSVLILHHSSSQVLLFPALSFGQAGRLSSLEFVTPELRSQIHVRFQTYRPHCHHPGVHLLLPSESDTHPLPHTHLTRKKYPHVVWWVSAGVRKT